MPTDIRELLGELRKGGESAYGATMQLLQVVPREKITPSVRKALQESAITSNDPYLSIVMIEALSDPNSSLPFDKNSVTFRRFVEKTARTGEPWAKAVSLVLLRGSQASK